MSNAGCAIAWLWLVACGGGHGGGADAAVADAGVIDTNVPTWGGGDLPAPSVFVATTGDDADPCSEAFPCATFDRAYRLAEPGQVVEVAAGHYPQQPVAASAKSSPERIVFRPAAGATVVIGCNGDQSCLDVSASHVVFTGMATDDFMVAGTPYQGRIDTEYAATDIIFDHMDVGAVAQGASGSLVQYCDLGPSVDPYNNRQVSSDDTWQYNVIHDYQIAQGGHMECMTWDGGTGITIRGNEWRNCVVFGIFAKPVENISGTVTGNWFWNPAAHTIQDDIKISVGSGATSCGVVVSDNWMSEGLYLDCPGAMESSGDSTHDPGEQPPVMFP